MSCIRCGASVPLIPLHPLEYGACPPCADVWIRDESLSVDTINAALGLSGRPEDFTPERQRKFDAELKARTEAWSRAWRAAA